MEDELILLKGNLGSWFSVCNLMGKELDFFKWKKTRIFFQMEDSQFFLLQIENDLNIRVNGKRPPSLAGNLTTITAKN
jgi:hypothetical protein